MFHNNSRAVFNILGSLLFHMHNELFFYWGNISIYIISYALRHQSDPSGTASVLTRQDNDHDVTVRPALALTLFEPSWLLAMTLGGYLTSQGSRIHIRPKKFLWLAILLQNFAFVVCYLLMDTSLTAVFTIFGLFVGLGCGLYDGVLVQNYVVNQSKRHTALLTSLALAGGPTGGVFIGQFVTRYTNPDNLSLSYLDGQTQVFRQKEVLDRVPSMLLILAGSLTLVQTIGLSLLTDIDTDSNEEDNIGNTSTTHTDVKVTNIETNTGKMMGYIPFGDNEDIGIESYAGKHDEAYLKGTVSIPHQNYQTIIINEKNTLGEHEDNGHENSKSESRERSVEVVPNQHNNPVHVEDDSFKTSGSIHTAVNTEVNNDDSYSPKELLRCASFYKLAAVYLLGVISRAVVSTYYKIYGQIWIKDDHFLTFLGTFQSICIIPASLAWGAAMDYVSVKVSLMFMYSTISISLMLMYFTAMWNRWAYFVATVCATMSTNVYMAFSVVTVSWFGRSHYAINMAAVESSAIFGIMVTSAILDTLIAKYGHFSEFFLSSLFSVIGLLVIAFALPYKLKKH